MCSVKIVLFQFGKKFIQRIAIDERVAKVSMIPVGPDGSKTTASLVSVSQTIIQLASSGPVSNDVYFKGITTKQPKTYFNNLKPLSVYLNSIMSAPKRVLPKSSIGTGNSITRILPPVKPKLRAPPVSSFAFHYYFCKVHTYPSQNTSVATKNKINQN